MNVDLCVVNYNTKHCLVRLFQSLWNEGGDYPFQMYLADNGSTDGSIEYLKEFSQPSFIKEIVFNSNIGYAAACNRLGSHGKAEIIGFLNADVWLTTEDVKKIQESFDNHPEMAIMGPKQRDEQGKVRAGPIVWDKPDSLKQVGWNKDDPNDKLYRDRVQCATVSGSAYFMRRSVFDDLASCSKFREFEMQENGIEPVGPFLRTDHFFEETYVSMHANHHGYQVWFDGSISIGHSWRASTGPSPILTEHFKTSSQIYKRACDYEGIRREKV